MGVQPGLTASGLPTGITLVGGNSPIQDGDTILYRNDSNVVQFEFDNDGNQLEDPNSDQTITFSVRDTTDEIAAQIANVLANTPGLDIGGARAVEGGRVYLGGDGNDGLIVNSASMTVRGSAGVMRKLELTIPANETGTTIDGQRVTVTSDGLSQTYLLTVDSAVVTTDEVVLLLPNDDAGDIAVALRDAITASFSANTLPLNPITFDNVIRLGEPDQVGPGRAPIQTTVDVSQSTLTTTGFGGGTVPIEFIPSVQFTEQSMASQIVAAVADSGLNVTASTPGGGLIYLDNVNQVTGQPLATVSAITDRAGNNLEANRSNRETAFTILMPGVELDFGDALLAGGGPTYPTLIADNGARHTVGGPRLGTFLDSEADANLVGDEVTASLSAPVGTGGLSGTLISRPGIEQAVLTIDSSIPLVDLSTGVGATATFTIGGTDRTYEMVLASGAPSLPTNVPVLWIPGEPASVTAERFASIVEEDIRSLPAQVSVNYQPNDMSFAVESVQDEDGVLIGSVNVGGQVVDGLFLDTDGSVLSFLNPLSTDGAEAVVNTTGGGLLDAWIDFNGDGDFTDPGEQVLRSKALLDGENRISIVSVPNPAVLNGTDTATTWARFRLSSTGNTTTDGVVIGGEVEGLSSEACTRQHAGTTRRLIRDFRGPSVQRQRCGDAAEHGHSQRSDSGL